jgi:hypothetical protein
MFICPLAVLLVFRWIVPPPSDMNWTRLDRLNANGFLGQGFSVRRKRISFFWTGLWATPESHRQTFYKPLITLLHLNLLFSKRTVFPRVIRFGHARGAGHDRISPKKRTQDRPAGPLMRFVRDCFFVLSLLQKIVHLLETWPRRAGR